MNHDHGNIIMQIEPRKSHKRLSHLEPWFLKKEKLLVVAMFVSLQTVKMVSL